MSMTTPIVDFVRSYAQSGTARLHMPGHKGQSLLGFEPLDITEICGADELYAPEGIIATITDIKFRITTKSICPACSGTAKLTHYIS